MESEAGHATTDEGLAEMAAYVDGLRITTKSRAVAR